MGEGVPDGQGSLTEKATQHLLLQFDSRFARCMAMLFALFNQLQRHAACRHVAVRVKGGSTGVGKFVELANDANFRSRLDSAIAAPTSADARAIAATVMRCARMCTCALISSAQRGAFERRRSALVGHAAQKCHVAHSVNDALSWSTIILHYAGTSRHGLDSHVATSVVWQCECMGRVDAVADSR